MLSVLGLALAGNATAATLTVGPSGTHATIADALAVAVDDDRIEIEPGTYPEFSQTVTVDLEIVGTGGSAVTTWEYGGLAQTLTADGVTLSLEGITFTGGARRALRFRSGSVVTLDDVVVVGMGDGVRDGPGMFVSGSAVVTGTAVTFDSNVGDLGGHVYVGGSAVFDCTGCTLVDGIGTDGGAIYGTSGAAVTLTDPTLRDNAAVDVGLALGGHVVSRQGTLDILGGSIDGGSADRGGQVRGTESDVTISGTLLTGGTATELGGAVAIDGGSLILSGVVIADGVAASVGGCVAIDDADLTITGSEITDCTLTDVDSFGGGLHTFGSGVTSITDTLFARNTSPSSGGGMRLADDGPATLLRVVAEDNVSGFGAAVHAGSPLLAITDSTFARNLGTHGGGVRWASVGGDLIVEGSTFDANDGSTLGGAVYAHDAGEVTLTDTVFTNNTGGDGGALYLNTLDALDAVRNLVCGNVATDDGGGAYSVNVTSETWTNNAFVQNDAASDGGALLLGGAASSRFAFNDVLGSAATTGAVRTLGGALSFTDNVLADTLSGGALHTAVAIPDADLVRNTWWANVPGDLSGAQSTWGADNQQVDPQLQIWSLDGDCSNDLLWPGLGSPLVDRGDPALTDPDGTRADRGTYGGPDADPVPFADDDSDGWILMFDCNDGDPTIFPFAPDPVDGIDQNCDGLDGCDGDADGWEAAACGGADCDDGDGTVLPDAPETAGDGIDSNCDGRDDPLPPAVDLSVTLENNTAVRWVGGVLAVLPEGGMLPSLLAPGPAPAAGDRFDTVAFGSSSCDPYGPEDDGDGAALISRWSLLADGVDGFLVGDLDPGTSVTVPFTARPGEVLSFVAWVDGSPDDVVVMHQVGDVLDTTVDLFNDLGWPLFHPRFDLAGYDLNSVDPADGTSADCAATCPSLGCYVAPGNGTVGLDAGGPQTLPPIDPLQTWPGFRLDPVPSTITENGVGSPTVVYRTALDDWVMLFETNTGTDPDCPVGTWAIGAATSPDGWNWTVEPSTLIGPSPGTYHSCVAAHPNATLDDDGASIHLWFKAEQDDLACMASMPAWGCGQYTGVGYAHLTSALTVDVLNPLPALATPDIFGFPTVIQAGPSRWLMVMAKFPELFLARATAPEGPYTLEPTAFLTPGMDSWNMTEIFNPALVCDPAEPEPMWMLYGGRTRMGVYGPIIEGGLAAATSIDLLNWTILAPYLTFVGDLPWRHWDAVRVGSERIVYFSEKDGGGVNHVGVAATTDDLAKVDVMGRSCP